MKKRPQLIVIRVVWLYYVYTQKHISIIIGHMSTNTAVLGKSTKEYRRRKPEYSPYYQCIEDYYEEFKRTYDRKFSQKYGYLRSHIEKVIYQYLDCGILHNGFARIRCSGCGPIASPKKV